MLATWQMSISCTILAFSKNLWNFREGRFFRLQNPFFAQVFAKITIPISAGQLGPSLNTENVFKSILVCALFVSENVPFFAIVGDR